MDLLPCDVDLDIFSLSSMNCMNYEEHVFICDLMISTIYVFFFFFSVHLNLQFQSKDMKTTTNCSKFQFLNSSLEKAHTFKKVNTIEQRPF